MFKEILSVIIPIYNGEKYLPRCVDSVINQSYKNIEIILVNDGSTDKTQIICEEYKEKDSRIKVISIKNSGIYQARKAGVISANGELITFVDSDDCIDIDTYKNLMSIYSKYSPDIISYTFQINDLGIANENYLPDGIYYREKIENKIT